VYIEKFLERPRHVEIQVFGDQHGHVMHFGERECSVQRRHQKLIEETPSPAVTPELRARMGQAAVQAAKAVGTLVPALSNPARPQRRVLLPGNEHPHSVEHPITELVYGVDLVRSQLRAAAG